MSIISYMSPSRVLSLLPDDNVNTPNISFTLINSVCTASGAGVIEDTTVDFIAAGVEAGDIIYDDTAGRVDDVTGVVSRTQVNTQFGHVTVGDSYRIFSGTNPGGGVLLVTGLTSGGLQQVVTMDGDIVQVGVWGIGNIIPLRVKKVFRTAGVTVTAPTYCMLWD